MFVLFLPSYISAEIVEEKPAARNHCNKISSKLAGVRYKECLSHKFEIAESLSVKGSPIFIKSFSRVK